MAKAEDEDWLAPREYVKRIAGDPAAETEAEYSIAERFRRGTLRYRYRDSNGELRYDDLSDDFRCEAFIDFAAATATRPERIMREPNPDLLLVRDGVTPKPQWIGDPLLQRDWDPFSRPDYIERKLPAETITELKFAIPRAPAVEPAAQKAPRRGRPSSALLVLEEAKRQLQGSDKEHHIRRGRPNFLAWLSGWLRDTHHRQMADKTIGDHLRENEEVQALLPTSWLRRR